MHQWKAQIFCPSYLDLLVNYVLELWVVDHPIITFLVGRLLSALVDSKFDTCL